MFHRPCNPVDAVGFQNWNVDYLQPIFVSCSIPYAMFEADVRSKDGLELGVGYSNTGFRIVIVIAEIPIVRVSFRVFTNLYSSDRLPVIGRHIITWRKHVNHVLS